MTHYDDEAWIRFGIEGGRDREMLDHLAGCALCRAKLAELETTDAAMRAPETWRHVDVLLQQSRGLEELLEEKARMDAEDEAAARLLAPLVRSPLRFRLANVGANKKARTAGVVRYLCAMARDLHEKRPQFSLELTTTAYEIAQTLEDRRGTLPPSLSIGLAVRERANALRYLGRFAEALDMLKYAEQIFEQSLVDRHDVAIVWFIRATVLMKMGHLEEARQLARKTARVFRAYADVRRELGAQLVVAACLILAERHSEAVQTYEQIAVKARALGDRNILARAANAAANLYLDLGHYDRAEQFYIEALVVFDERGLTTEKARVEWSLALVAVRRGDLDTGAERLDAARAELLRLGLLHDHALATLDWAAARIAGEQPEGVAAACREIMIRFESEDMMRNARLALAYVHEALARGHATAQLIQHVRTYLEQLPSSPASPFLPLQ